MDRVRLNRELTLETPQTTPDGAGGFERTWTPLGTLWAELRARTGRETEGAVASLSRMRFRIIVRAAPVGAPSRPQPGQRFRDGARVFAVRAVAEHDQGARYLTCFAEEEIAV
ncbi:head-tail adaptor protein [Roseovarius salinarum]|uniref:head-tail adaptor protein n=1 Tax=Roseovarius salinarum TaxID=1981892 RepID=UPI000C34C814|nr:head-tail adaptor protein [Roseovarius salinarum]